MPPDATTASVELAHPHLPDLYEQKAQPSYDAFSASTDSSTPKDDDVDVDVDALLSIASDDEGGGGGEGSAPTTPRKAAALPTTPRWMTTSGGSLNFDWSDAGTPSIPVPVAPLSRQPSLLTLHASVATPPSAPPAALSSSPYKVYVALVLAQLMWSGFHCIGQAQHSIGITVCPALPSSLSPLSVLRSAPCGA